MSEKERAGVWSPQEGRGSWYGRKADDLPRAFEDQQRS